ncbi:MAG: Bug family tripartite tricarboxylate transporter substrate binding protein [Comamonas sp.]
MALLKKMMIGVAAATLGTAFLASSALAQNYPSKPIRWILGFSPGGGTDVLARTIAAPLSQQLKEQVIVENRPGAGGMIAAEAVARSAPDGYTVLTADISILALNPSIYSKVRYDALNDFVSLGMMARFPAVIATHPESNIKTLKDLLATKNFGFATPGVGTPHHMAMEVVLSSSGAAAQHIPYKGDAPAIQDLYGRQIPSAVLSANIALPFIKEGKITPLAVTSEQRMAQLPDVPTLKELGLSPIGIYAWQGMVAPKGTPEPIVKKLSQELAKAVGQPEVQSKLAEIGMEPISSGPAEMDSYVKEQHAFWGQLIRSRGIKADSN